MRRRLMRFSFRSRQKPAHDAGHLVAVEAKLRRGSAAELVHPVGGSGRFIPPADGRSEHEVDVPCRQSFGQVDDRPVKVSQMRVPVEVARHSRIGNAPALAPRCGFPRSRTQHRQPDDVGAQVRVGDLRENLIFDYGGPP